MLLKFLLLLCFPSFLTASCVKKCLEGSVPTATNPEMCYTLSKWGEANPTATYDEAETLCNKKGGHLASIPNQEENDYLYGLLSSTGIYWIGINDIKNHGAWAWEDGSQVEYLNWGSMEPSKDCGTFDNHSNKWFTSNCDYSLNYICLIPAI